MKWRRADVASVSHVQFNNGNCHEKQRYVTHRCRDFPGEALIPCLSIFFKQLKRPKNDYKAVIKLFG